jgi:hypothetical protein
MGGKLLSVGWQPFTVMFCQTPESPTLQVRASCAAGWPGVVLQRAPGVVSPLSPTLAVELRLFYHPRWQPK